MQVLKRIHRVRERVRGTNKFLYNNFTKGYKVTLYSDWLRATTLYTIYRNRLNLGCPRDNVNTAIIHSYSTAVWVQWLHGASLCVHDKGGRSAWARELHKSGKGCKLACRHGGRNVGTLCQRHMGLGWRPEGGKANWMQMGVQDKVQHWRFGQPVQGPFGGPQNRLRWDLRPCSEDDDDSCNVCSSRATGWYLH